MRTPAGSNSCPETQTHASRIRMNTTIFLVSRWTWGRGEACEVGKCGRRCFRFCRVCGRYTCPDHRFGAGWWWRCPSCSSHQLGEAIREWRAQILEEEREHRALHRRCRCGAWYVRRVRGWWTDHLPSCRCPSAHLVTVPNVRRLRAALRSPRRRAASRCRATAQRAELPPASCSRSPARQR